MVVGVALFASHAFRPSPVIDQELVFAIAESQGHLSPEATRKLREQVARTQTDLEALHQQYPDWASEIDRAINAFNESDIEGARSAFEEIDDLIIERRADLRLEHARSKHAQATLFHPFDFSKAVPLLCEAAELAASEVSYRIECGRGRLQLGDLSSAFEAFRIAHDITSSSGDLKEQSRALDGIGNVRFMQGQFDAALVAFQGALEIDRDLSSREPDNALWTRYISISLSRIGDVHVAQNNFDAALDVYRESLNIRRELVATEPDNALWTRDVTYILEKVGSVLVLQGNLDAALDAYRESLNIRRALVATKPDNALLVIDLAASLRGIGSVHLREGQLSAAHEATKECLDITRDIVAQYPGNTAWASQLLTCIGSFGDVLFAQGKYEAALDAFTESLDMARDLVAQDPSNANWIRYIKVSLKRIGNLHNLQGDPDKAILAYQESLDMARSLAEMDSGNARLLRDVWHSLWTIAEIDQANAVEHWAAVVAYMEETDAKGLLPSSDEAFLDTARQNLTEAKQ